MSIVHHGPSSDHLVKRLASIGVKASAGSYGCRAVTDNLNIYCEIFGRGQYGNTRKWRIAATFSDSDYHSQTTSIQFKLQDTTEDKSSFRESVEHDRDVPEEVWEKFVPKLKQWIERSEQEEERKTLKAKDLNESNARYQTQAKWMRDNAPSFSLGIGEVRFLMDPLRFDEIKDRIKAAHDALFSV